MLKFPNMVNWISIKEHIFEFKFPYLDTFELTPVRFEPTTQSWTQNLLDQRAS